MLEKIGLQWENLGVRSPKLSSVTETRLGGICGADTDGSQPLAENRSEINGLSGVAQW